MKGSRFDPRNSFFGRIFFWFWIVTISSIGTGVLVAFLLAPASEYSEPTPQQLVLLERLAERLERMPIVNQRQLVRAMRQLSGPRDYQMFVIDAASREFTYNFPPPARPTRRIYEELLTESEPVIVTRANTRFAGPVKIQLMGREHALFAGTIRHPAASRKTLIGVVIFVALIVSGILCYILARSFSQPLQEIKAATEKLAKGDLASRVKLSRRRTDEFESLSDATNTMAEQLQKLFDEHQRFLADVSHELRSPLTRLQLAIGIAEQSQMDQSAEDVISDPVNDSIGDSTYCKVDMSIIERISKESEQMESMIAQLLWLSRMNANSGRHQFEHIPIQVWLDSDITPMVEDLNFEAESIGKQLSVAFPEKPNGTVHVASSLLLSAIENVCRNALKYAQSSIEICVELKLGNLVMTVADDGDGVDAGELALLFKPFYRTDTSRNRQTGGVGLGLSIAQRAIERHGGNIEARLRQPSGLSIVISLPIDNDK